MQLRDELAIPFDAFAAAVREDIDEITDEIDGDYDAAEPSGSAAVPIDPPLYAPPARVVVAVAGDDLSIDSIIDAFLDGLADLCQVAPEVYQGQTHEHHDPADLDYWAEVDVARGRLATHLDITVAKHRPATPRGAYVMTVEGPAHRVGALVSAAEAASEVTRRALLTSAGPVSTEPAESPVLRAAALHAHRMGGQAEVFPGQEWLAADLPVAQVLGRTAVEDVRSTQGPYAPDAVLRAYGFVRPHYDAGQLVLTVGHDDPLVVTPWAARYCRPCCGADH